MVEFSAQLKTVAMGYFWRITQYERWVVRGRVVLYRHICLVVGIGTPRVVGQNKARGTHLGG